MLPRIKKVHSFIDFLTLLLPSPSLLLKLPNMSVKDMDVWHICQHCSWTLYNLASTNSIDYMYWYIVICIDARLNSSHAAVLLYCYIGLSHLTLLSERKEIDIQSCYPHCVERLIMSDNVLYQRHVWGVCRYSCNKIQIHKHDSNHFDSSQQFHRRYWLYTILIFLDDLILNKRKHVAIVHMTFRIPARWTFVLYGLLLKTFTFELS